MLGVGNPLASSVVYQYNVHVVSCWTCLAEVAGICCRGLARTGAAKHTLEDGQTLVVGDNLFQTNGGNVEARTRG